eukprot:m.112588 g.112588  ORF g.112588 m.112588 type:complete len:497 (-) comp9119_c0_seq2:468-1958(-)
MTDTADAAGGGPASRALEESCEGVAGIDATREHVSPVPTSPTSPTSADVRAEEALEYYRTAVARSDHADDIDSDIELEGVPSTPASPARVPSFTGQAPSSPAHAGLAGLANVFSKVLSPFHRLARAAPPPTTAPTAHLILEARPSNLPAKTPEEERRHRLQFEAMMEGSRRKQAQDEERRLRLEAARRKKEQAILCAQGVWLETVLPDWKHKRDSKRVHDLAWAGVPPRVRGRVWSLAIGNELNITPELFDIYKARAHQHVARGKAAEKAAGFEASVQLIGLDISRTYPKLCMFQTEGPFYHPLLGLLGAYVFFRPDVGYVQGMSFAAAVLLLSMEPADAFIAFANLYNRPCLRAFARLNIKEMDVYFRAYAALLAHHEPRVYAYMKHLEIRHDVYLTDWFLTAYSRGLPLEAACRVWDVFFLEGDYILARVAIGVLRHFREQILTMDFDTIMVFMKNLPETLSDDRLMATIAATHVTAKEFEDALARAAEDQPLP